MSRIPRLTAALAVVTAVLVVCGGSAAPRSIGPLLPTTPVTGAPLSLVGLGDSIPAGDECRGCTPFVELYGQQLAQARSAPVTVNNLGVGGWTSSDLLGALQPGGDDADLVASADVVTVTIGANDFGDQLATYLAGDCGNPNGLGCFQPYLPQLRTTLAEVLDRVASLRAGRSTQVFVTGYWNVFPDGAVARDQYGASFLLASAALTAQANAVIRSVATEHGAGYADLATAFKGPDAAGDPTRLLADDGEHPDQQGHQLIADVIAQIGLSTLRR